MDSSGSRQEPVVGSCERGNDSCGFPITGFSGRTFAPVVHTLLKATVTLHQYSRLGKELRKTHSNT
jgi:hypothetical protein